MKYSPLEIEELTEEALEEFNKGPTNGTLNDKRRMARIYEVLLDLKYLLENKLED